MVQLPVMQLLSTPSWRILTGLCLERLARRPQVTLYELVGEGGQGHGHAKGTGQAQRCKGAAREGARG